MGFLDGEPIASISVVKYGEDFGFLGFYIVRPDYRGRGYGWQLWQAGMNALKGRNVGLDGVVEQQDNYVKSGFKLAHRNIRYEGIGDAVQAQPTWPKGGDASLVPLSSVPLKTVMAYDRTIFQEERSVFLGNWVSSVHHTAIGVQQNKKLVGYGVLRPCQQGYKIGPLFADTLQFAEALYWALKTHVEPDTPFYLDVPEINEAAVALAQKEGMKRVFETARMYTKEPPALPLNKIFGITTFELG